MRAEASRLAGLASCVAARNNIDRSRAKLMRPRGAG